MALELQAQFITQSSYSFMLYTNPLRSQFTSEFRGLLKLVRKDATAHFLQSFQDGHIPSPRLKPIGSGQASQAGTDHYA